MLAVRAERGQDDLYFVAEAFGEEGAEGAINQPAEQDRLFAGPALAAEKIAWDASCGVQFFLEIDRQWEEADAWPDAAVHRGGGEDDCVPATDGYGAACLLGEDAGFDADLFFAQRRGVDLGAFKQSELFHLCSPRNELCAVPLRCGAHG